MRWVPNPGSGVQILPPALRGRGLGPMSNLPSTSIPSPAKWNDGDSTYLGVQQTVIGGDPPGGFSTEPVPVASPQGTLTVITSPPPPRPDLVIPWVPSA